MRFHFNDFILGSSATLLIMSVSIWGGRLVGGLLGALTGLLLVVIQSTVLIRLIAWSWPVAPGHLPMTDSTRNVTVWKLLGFLNTFNLGLIGNGSLIPVPARWLLYRVLGSKIGPSVMVGSKVVEPLMIEVGRRVILGEDSLILGHAIVGTEVFLGKVLIGDNATIGARAVLMPDVEIGAGAVIGVGAVVTRGSRIGPGEIWLGIPARPTRRPRTRPNHKSPPPSQIDQRLTPSPYPTKEPTHD